MRCTTKPRCFFSFSVATSRDKADGVSEPSIGSQKSGTDMPVPASPTPCWNVCNGSLAVAGIGLANGDRYFPFELGIVGVPSPVAAIGLRSSEDEPAPAYQKYFINFFSTPVTLAMKAATPNTAFCSRSGTLGTNP
jgi:hypothetical protein